MPDDVLSCVPYAHITARCVYSAHGLGQYPEVKPYAILCLRTI